MTPTRHALLLSNPGEPGQSNYCKGVYVDIRNYRNLLLSPVGGWWSENEITHLDRPTVRDVRARLAQLTAHDYVLVMFSGHGAYSSADRDRILELRAGENLASLELSAGARKRTVILDCCQQVHTESLLEERARKNAIATFSARRAPNPATCRQLFFEAIQRAPAAVVRMYSCATGELSTDSDERGGFYNGSLVECVADWLEKQATRASAAGATYSVVDAHECAAAATRRLSDGKQNPVIEKPRTDPYFPFATFG